MNILSHILLFGLSTAVIWFLSGILIDATDRVAKRYRKPGFAVAFIVLGFLTSISEISVAVNSTLEGVPQVSAGNLLGASLVIFLLIIPLLAVAGGGIPIGNVMTKRTIILLLTVVFLPALIASDGLVDRTEGVVLLLLYCCLLYGMKYQRAAGKTVKEALTKTEHALIRHRGSVMVDAAKILFGGMLIFVAGNILVHESVFLAGAMGVPVSVVGLLLLSIGTNIPELVIAMRGILGGHKDIAFGDYMGSAAANTVIFAALSLWNGSFRIVQSEAILTLCILLPGLVLFWFFIRSYRTLSRKEGVMLLLLYALFLGTQIGNTVRISGQEELKSGPPIIHTLP